MKYEPLAPIPEPSRGNEAGSFTQKSIVERLPEIGRRMLEENHFPRPVEAQIETLIREIPNGRIRMLADINGPDVVDWTGYLIPYLGQNWLNPPWFFIEHYFYRRVIEAIDYFRLGIDPFYEQKARGLRTSHEAINGIAKVVHGMLEQPRTNAEQLVNLFKIDLWGNQADLSMWPNGPDEKLTHQDEAQQEAHTLIDQAEDVIDYLLINGGSKARIDFLIDNAGLELVADLALMAALLLKNLAGTIVIHTKPHPTFVSDATNSDVWWIVQYLLKMGGQEALNLGRTLQLALNTGRLRLQSHFFWTSPLDGWQMPEGLRQELGQARLLICNFTTSFADIVSYLPAPLVALRTLKSEVAVGLTQEQITALVQRDPDWLVNGRWGVLQFYNNKESYS